MTSCICHKSKILLLNTSIYALKRFAKCRFVSGMFVNISVLKTK